MYSLDDAIIRQIEKNEGIFQSREEMVQIYEVWGEYEIGNKLQKFKMMVEPNTATISTLMANHVVQRRKPFVAIRLEAREHSITGIGVADQIGDLNEEINTIHNQTIDATSVSICGMFGVRPGTPAWDALEKIYPGKRIPRTSAEDIQEVGMGPLKVNSIPLEEVARSYGERRTGISDFSMGREPSAARRGTATGTMAIIQEGNKKHDYQITDCRKGLGEVGFLVLSMVQQMYPDGRDIMVLGEDAAEFSKISLAFPTDISLDAAIAVEVQTTNSNVNRQVRTQNAITQFQLVSSMYAQALQLAQLLSVPGTSPSMINLGMQMAKGATICMKDILTAFENRRADEILPDLEEIYAQIGAVGLAQGFAAAAGLGAPGGGMPGEGGGGPGGGGGGQGGPPGGGVQAQNPAGASPEGRLGGPSSTLNSEGAGFGRY
jgi:hypothetical protein